VSSPSKSEEIKKDNAQSIVQPLATLSVSPPLSEAIPKSANVIQAAQNPMSMPKISEPVLQAAQNPMSMPMPKVAEPVKSQSQAKDKFSEEVDRLAEMGYPKEEVIKALKATHNNVEMATEMLINVIIH
jgi:Holliday junction resolvasome RuvABC DNA-binding subunit